MKRIFVMLVLMLPVIVIAQEKEREVVGSSGEAFFSQELQVSWTIGEMVIAPFVSEDLPELFLYQGFHQGDSDIETNIVELSDRGLNCKVFPNPAQDHLMIETSNSDQFIYGLYDLTGNLIVQDQIVTQSKQIDVSELLPAIYILKIANRDGLIQNIKIQIQ